MSIPTGEIKKEFGKNLRAVWNGIAKMGCCPLRKPKKPSATQPTYEGGEAQSSSLQRGGSTGSNDRSIDADGSVKASDTKVRDERDEVESSSLQRGGSIGSNDHPIEAAGSVATNDTKAKDEGGKVESSSLQRGGSIGSNNHPIEAAGSVATNSPKATYKRAEIESSSLQQDGSIGSNDYFIKAIYERGEVKSFPIPEGGSLTACGATGHCMDDAGFVDQCPKGTDAKEVINNLTGPSVMRDAALRIVLQRLRDTGRTARKISLGNVHSLWEGIVGGDFKKLEEIQGKDIYNLILENIGRAKGQDTNMNSLPSRNMDSLPSMMDSLSSMNIGSLQSMSMDSLPRGQSLSMPYSQEDSTTEVTLGNPGKTGMHSPFTGMPIPEAPEALPTEAPQSAFLPQSPFGSIEQAPPEALPTEVSQSPFLSQSSFGSRQPSFGPLETPFGSIDAPSSLFSSSQENEAKDAEKNKILEAFEQLIKSNNKEEMIQNTQALEASFEPIKERQNGEHCLTGDFYKPSSISELLMCVINGCEDLSDLKKLEQYGTTALLAVFDGKNNLSAAWRGDGMMAAGKVTFKDGKPQVTIHHNHSGPNIREEASYSGTHIDPCNILQNNGDLEWNEFSFTGIEKNSFLIAATDGLDKIIPPTEKERALRARNVNLELYLSDINSAAVDASNNYVREATQHQKLKLSAAHNRAVIQFLFNKAHKILKSKGEDSNLENINNVLPEVIKDCIEETKKRVYNDRKIKTEARLLKGVLKTLSEHEGVKKGLADIGEILDKQKQLEKLRDLFEATPIADKEKKRGKIQAKAEKAALDEQRSCLDDITVGLKPLKKGQGLVMGIKDGATGGGSGKGGDMARATMKSMQKATRALNSAQPTDAGPSS